MARYRIYTVEFKRQVVEEHLGGGTSLNQLARRHDISRELLRTWVKKYEAGEFAGGGPPKVDRRAYEAKIAGLERTWAATRPSGTSSPGSRASSRRCTTPSGCTPRSAT
jgi:transposase-like protein